MKKLMFILILLQFAILGFAQQENNEVTTYYLIRHAEKTDSENKNPNLNMKGKLRAEKWMNVFRNVKFDAIYSTNYNRTIETAKPTSLNKNLKIITYDFSEINYQNFLKETKGQIVLIVGHSNTTPEFVNNLIRENKYGTIDHYNNCNLYIVEFNGDIITDKLLYIE